MRILLPATIILGAAALASPAVAQDVCTAATAKPSSVAAIIAGDANSGDCVTLSAIGWKGALYDNVAQIYAEPRRARDPQGGGNRIAFYPPYRINEDEDAGRREVRMLGEPGFPAEALDAFGGTARYVTAVGMLRACRHGATHGPQLTLPFAVDADACNGPGGMRFDAVAATIEERSVDRLTGPASPSRLAPLAADSPWLPRFAAAADTLFVALRSRDERQWVPLLGGQWLAAADRARVAALLRDGKSPFRQALFSRAAAQSTILGWQLPAAFSAEARAEIDARPEAEALVCWSSLADPELWPRAAFDADNQPGRPYACARIAYSIREGKPTWRAFIEEGPGGLAEPRR